MCASIRAERRSPPKAPGRASPCSRSRWRHLLMLAALTLKRSAAARCERPCETAARTRTRKSIDKAFDMSAASCRRTPMNQTKADLHSQCDSFRSDSALKGHIPMNAVVIHAAKDLRIEDRPVEAPGPGQVEVAIEADGICGSDLRYYNHGGFGASRVREPMILGHEVAGTIKALGAGVSGLAVSDRVAVSPSRPAMPATTALKASRTIALTCVFTALPCRCRIFRVPSGSRWWQKPISATRSPRAFRSTRR